MANNHDQFIEFDKAISLSKNKKEQLISQRQSLRDKISNYFSDNYGDEIQPEYRMQSSFAIFCGVLLLKYTIVIY